MTNPATARSVEEFVIDAGKRKLLEEHKAYVEKIFGVKIQLPLPESGNVLNQWVHVEQGTNGDTKLARVYIESLCLPEHELTISVTRDLFYGLKDTGFIEKQSGAVVDFKPENTVLLRGTDIAVVTAKSIIEEKLSSVAKEREGASSAPKCIAAPVEPQLPCQLHPTLVNFALKLGYSTEDIDRVVRKYGTDINQNKLLEELIRCKSDSTADRRLSKRGPAPANNDDGIMTRGPPVSRTRSPNDVITARGSPVSRPRPSAPAVIADGCLEDAFAPRLRPIVIDGSNVAMEHGNQQVFSCRGIQICVDWFRRRGHTDITVFVPRSRIEVARPDKPITNKEVLSELYHAGILKFTPCKTLGSRHFDCYDDRFILDLAKDVGGIVVSNDKFRDLHKENPAWKEVIEERVLRYTIASDRFMPPSDPLGRQGPCLDDFLRKGTATHPQICPYINNCTFGLRCRYFHPERNKQRLSSHTPPAYSTDTRASLDYQSSWSTPYYGNTEASELRQPRSSELYGYAMYPRADAHFNWQANCQVEDQVDGIGAAKERGFDEKLYQKLKEIFPGRDEDIKDNLKIFPNKDLQFLVWKMSD